MGVCGQREREREGRRERHTESEGRRDSGREKERGGEWETGCEGGRENERACCPKKRKYITLSELAGSFLRKCISKNMTCK